MILASARGWHPRPSPCSRCDREPPCDECRDSGAFSTRYVINDGFYVDGGCVATIESFADDGPFYANAITPQGEWYRRGACGDLAVAVAWAERVAGQSPLQPDDLKYAARLA